MNYLTLIMAIPFLGAALIATLPQSKSLLAKQLALGTTLVAAAATIFMTTKFERSNTALQFVESYDWIKAFGIKYAVGVDGIALVLILMTALLTPIVVLAGWNESEGGRWSTKTFYILILVLQTMSFGVFAATDVFLFYVFFEAMLVPVYFLIGGYGSGERSAAAVKFLLYSLFGGLLMLASVIALYVLSGEQGGHTFDIGALSQLEMSSTTQNLLFLGFFIAFADSLLPNSVSRCIKDIYPAHHHARCDFNSLRCISCNRRKRHQALNCLHIYFTLWIHHTRYLRDDDTSSKWCNSLYVQPRLLNSSALPSGWMDDFSSRLFNNR